MSSLRFLGQTNTFEQVSSVEISDIFGKGYKAYQVFIDCIDASGDSYFHVRFIDSSGSIVTASDNNTAGVNMMSWTGYDNTWKSNNTNSVMWGMGAGNSEEGGAMVLWVFNPDQSDNYTQVFSMQGISASNYGGARGLFGGGVLKQNASMGGLYLVQQGGDCYWKVSVYGLEGL